MVDDFPGKRRVSDSLSLRVACSDPSQAEFRLQGFYAVRNIHTGYARV